MCAGWRRAFHSSTFKLTCRWDPRYHAGMSCIIDEHVSKLVSFLSAVWSLHAVVVSSLLVADLLLQCGRRSGTLGCRKSYKWVRRPHQCFLSRHRISSRLRRQVKEMLRISGKILAFGLRQQPRCRLGWSHHQPKYYLLLDRPAHVHGSHELCQASQVK